MTVTSVELDTIRQALGSATGAEADALLGAVDWYIQELPQPGEDKEEAKSRKEAEDGTLDVDVDAEVDDMLGDGADLPGGAAPPDFPEPGADVEVEAEVDELIPDVGED